MTSTTTITTGSHGQRAAAPTPDLVVLSGQGIARLVELLDHCHTFLTTSETARDALAGYCTTQPDPIRPAWVVEQLAWHAALLDAQLAEQVEEDRHG